MHAGPPRSIRVRKRGKGAGEVNPRAMGEDQVWCGSGDLNPDAPKSATPQAAPDRDRSCKVLIYKSGHPSIFAVVACKTPRFPTPLASSCKAVLNAESYHGET